MPRPECLQNRGKSNPGSDPVEHCSFDRSVKGGKFSSLLPEHPMLGPAEDSYAFLKSMVDFAASTGRIISTAMTLDRI